MKERIDFHFIVDNILMGALRSGLRHIAYIYITITCDVFVSLKTCEKNKHNVSKFDAFLATDWTCNMFSHLHVLRGTDDFSQKCGIFQSIKPGFSSLFR